MDARLLKLPQDFLHKLRKIYPHKFSEVAGTFLKKKQTTFRVNYLKTDLVSLRKQLVQDKVKFRELNYPRGAFILHQQDLRFLQKTNAYKDGLVYVQNVSSMLPVLFLDLALKAKVLDMCAAPGAKTTQILSLAKKENISLDIQAIEKIRVRYYKLMANLNIQGAQIKPLLMDAVLVRKKFPQYFDRILLDAPCSCEGLFYINNPRTFKYWKPRKVKEMAHKQKRLIQSAFLALKEKGVLVYSTCTFSPQENEEVIDWLLNRFKERIEVMAVNIPLKNTREGFVKWGGKSFSSQLKLTKRVLPNDFMEGFFIAKIRKIN